MRLKLPERFKLSVPARKVVLLPDTYFFCRAVPIAENATPAEASAQVDLALEALAPFPVAQMYHGHFWRPGAKHACVFAAYRKRFTAEQTESWADAEAVLPTFATLLGAQLTSPSTLLLWSDRGLTALNWDDVNDAPVSVISRELPPEPDDVARTALRDLVLRESGGGRTVIELGTAPVLEAEARGDDFVFRGETSTSYTREQLDVLDVRDKEELAARRRGRARDLLLWRALLGCVAAIALSACLELVMIGGSIWQKGRTAIVDGQEPFVAELLTAKNLATRIEDRSTRRMRPFEMIFLLEQKKTPSIIFVSTTVTAPNFSTLVLDGQSTSSADVEAFKSALTGMPWCERVDRGTRGGLASGLTTFQLIVTFKPEAFVPVAVAQP